MGYDVHITRAEDWRQSESDPISLNEWHSYLRSDPEMRSEARATVKSPTGHVIIIEGDAFAVWIAHPERPVWFGYKCGRINVKNPDPPILEKMSRIAVSLNARVLGDEGEEYGRACAGHAPRD